MKTTQEKIAVMQAYVDGKRIECTSNSEVWYLLQQQEGSATWDWLHYDYRVAVDMDQKAFGIYWEVAHPCVTPSQLRNTQQVKIGLRAVIDAVKRGELK